MAFAHSMLTPTSSLENLVPVFKPKWGTQLENYKTIPNKHYIKQENKHIRGIAKKCNMDHE